MLTTPAPERSPARRPRSLRQEYEEFVLEQIEEYKDQLPRDALLRLADEAVQELEIGPDQQLVLTEVLLLDHVDRLITRHLKLPSFRRWRAQHVRVREAQRNPSHWDLDPHNPLAELVRRLEETDTALAVGPAASRAGFYLAAHDASVLFIDQELAAVESVERRAASEGLASRLRALVISMQGWFPEVTAALVVLDPRVLEELGAPARMQLVTTLKAQTVSGGVHCVMPVCSHPGVIPITAESLHTFYTDWSTRRTPRAMRSRWFLATKP
jgi:hypothetical protein